MKIRKALQRFAEKMESQLKANDHKSGWIGCSFTFLEDELNRNNRELRSALFSMEDTKEIIKRCANVANFAMMIADNLDKQIGDKWKSNSKPPLSKFADKAKNIPRGKSIIIERPK